MFNIDNITLKKAEALKQQVLQPLLGKYGVVVVPGYLDLEKVETLQNEYDVLLDMDSCEYLNTVNYSEGKGCKVFLHELNSGKFEATFETFNSVFFHETAKQYLKDEFVLNKEVYVVKDVVGSKHHANDLHYDVAPTLKFFIYLNDTTAENGAFYCVPGSQKWTRKVRQKHGHKISTDNRQFTRQLTDQYGDAIPIEAPAGTLIIFYTDVFHKAGTVTKGERRVMRGHTRTVPRSPGFKKVVQKIRQKIGI